MTNRPSEMTPREEAAYRLIVQQVISRLASSAESQQRAVAAGLFTRVGQRESLEYDGHDLGLVQMDRGASGVKITDYRAFMAWVKDTNPTAILTTETVVEAWQRRLLADIKKGDWVDQETGEVLPLPPGVETYASEPKLVVKPSPDAERLVLEALKDLLGAGAVEVLGFTPKAIEQ